MSLRVYPRTDVAPSLRPVSHPAVDREVHLQVGEEKPGWEVYAIIEMADRAALPTEFFFTFCGPLPGDGGYRRLRRLFRPPKKRKGSREIFSPPVPQYRAGT